MLAMLVTFSTLQAQNLPYEFSVANNVVLENMTASITLFGANQSETTSPVLSLPFNFAFNGINYSECTISSDGFMGLGTTPVYNFPYDFILTTSLTYPIIVPWFDISTTGLNGHVKLLTKGNAGARKFIIEWKVIRYDAIEVAANYDVVQVWLYEGSNKIQFVYGSGNPDDFSNSSVGLAAATSSFISINTVGHNISSTENFRNHFWAGNGKSYVFKLPGTVLDDLIVSNITSTNLPCNGSNNGSIQLNSITGGDGTYTITWTGPNNFVGTGSSLSNLVAGAYTYTVNDNSQTSSVTGTITIAQPQILVAAVTGTTNIKCFGATNGSFSVNASGGVAPYTYTLGNTTNTSGAFTNIAAGNYTVIVSDANECTAIVNTSITQPAALNVNLKVYPEYTVENHERHTIYQGYGPQSVLLVGSTGNSSLPSNQTYVWSPAIPLSSTLVPVAFVSPVQTTTYHLAITDASGCTQTKDVTIYVVDVRCGSKISVCKNGKQECISEGKVNSYLNNGYKLGACNAPITQNRMEIINESIAVADKELNIYPIPSTGKIQVRLGNNISGAVTASIVNASGKIIIQQLLNTVPGGSLSFNLTNQPQGLYYIRIVGKTKSYSSKFVIIH